MLLLEAGPRDAYPWIHIPLGYHKLFAHPRYNWKLESEPVAGLCNRTSYQPRGKMLGGTSSLNGMVYMRGAPADYDGWRQGGCEGWDFAGVLPYFKKAENQQRGASELHGVGGPVRVGDQELRHELVDALIEASVEAGLPRNADFNGATQEGVGRYQMTAHAGRRCSAAVAYLKPVRRRANLVVLANAQGRRAVAAGRGLGGVYASHLLLSGIGPGAHLREMGIPLLHELPAVGANLHDHFNSYVAFRSTRRITLNDFAASPMRMLAAGLQYALSRRGHLAGNGLYCGAFTRSAPRFDRPDLQMNFMLWSIDRRDGSGVYPHSFPGFSLSPLHFRPEGRGSVRLRSPDPLAPPSIRFAFLTTANDVAAMLHGMHLARTIARQPALRDYVAEEAAR